MRLFPKLFFTVAGLVVGVVLMGATTVSAQSSGGMGGRPANPDPNNPRTQSIFIFTVDRGESAIDTILVSNNSDQTKTVELYAVDGIVTNTGSYSCSQQSEAKQGVGSWVGIDKSSVTLDAGKSEKVNFQLTMPAGADVGEHNGCIVFQEKASEDTSSGNVRVLTRQAIRVVATAPGELKREISIAEFTIHTVNNNPSFNLKLKNTGNVSADVDTKVQLTTLFGGVAYENGGGYPVLANQQLELTFVDEDRPMFGGWYYASASISYDKRAGTFGTDDPTNLVTEQTDKTMVFVAPTLLGATILIVLVLGVGAAVLWYVLRQRRQADAEKTWKTYTVKHDDNIQSIASGVGIGWKKLATVNHINAPYTLEVGGQLKVPAPRVKKTPKIKKSSTN